MNQLTSPPCFRSRRSALPAPSRAGRWLFALGAAALTPGGLAAADIESYIVEKLAFHFQETAAAVEFEEVEAIISVNATEPASVVGATVTLPPPSNLELGLMPEGDGDGELFAEGIFDSVAEADAAFPDGVYTLVVDTANDGEQTLPLDLSPVGGRRFPDPPRLTNFNALAAVPPGVDFTLTWAPFRFPGGGQPGPDDFIIVWLEGCDDEDDITRPPFGGDDGRPLLRGDATSVDIPGELLSPGQTYEVGLAFAHLVDDNDADGNGVDDFYPGAFGLAVYIAETAATLVTSGASGGPCRAEILLQVRAGGFSFGEAEGGRVEVDRDTPQWMDYQVAFDVRDSDIPTAGEVLFTGPAGSGLSGVAAEFGGDEEGHGQAFFQSPSNPVPPYPPSGEYAVRYKGEDIPRALDLSAAASRHRTFDPTVHLDGELVDSITWQLRDPSTGEVANLAAPAREVRLFLDTEDDFIFRELPGDATGVDLSSAGIRWEEVRFFNLEYEDLETGILYVTFFDAEGGGQGDFEVQDRPLAEGVINVNYQDQVFFQGGAQGNVNWRLVDGELPPGVELLNNGQVIGVPTATGRFDFTVEAFDDGGQTARGSFTIEVAPIGNAAISLGFAASGLLGQPGGNPETAAGVLAAPAGNFRYAMVFSIQGEGLPRIPDVTFFGPAGSGIQFDAQQAFAFGDSAFANGAVNIDPADPGQYPPSGVYSARFMGTDYTETFDTSAAVDDAIIPVPSFTLDRGQVETVSWSFVDPVSGAVVDPAFDLLSYQLNITRMNGPSFSRFEFENVVNSVDVRGEGIPYNDIASVSIDVSAATSPGAKPISFSGDYTGGSLGFEQVDEIILEKAVEYTQADPVAPVLDGYRFLVEVVEDFPGVLASVTVTPDGRAPITVPRARPDEFGFDSGRVASPATLNAAYPDGGYGVVLTSPGGQTVQVGLTIGADGYPNAPQVTNFSEAQSIDPAQPFTLRFNNLIAGQRASEVEVCVFDAGGQDVWESDPLDAGARQATIPAGVLQPGRGYTAQIFFFLTWQDVTGAIPGVGGFIKSFHTASTQVPIRTVGGGSPFENWVAERVPDALRRGPGDDPGGNGVSNFGSFAFGLDPLGGGRDGLPRAELGAGNNLVLRHRRAGAAAGLNYAYEMATDPANGPWTPITNGSVQFSPRPDGNEDVTLTVPLPAGAPSVFVRARVME